MANEFVRNLIDIDKVITFAIPAAAANGTSTSIDTEQTTGGIIESIAFEVSVPTLANLVDTKVITIKVYDSADNSSFAVIDPLISTTVTGTGAGGIAKSVRFRLPPTARRYIALNVAVESGGGNNTASVVTFRALF